ncbi:hypothetical protein Tco_0153443 [Tanacetum coccineum]
MDFDFIPSHNDLGSDLDVSSPSGDRNKIYDPGICIEVESKRFLTTWTARLSRDVYNICQQSQNQIIVAQAHDT